MAERHVSLEDHVTCSICMDLYRDPLALPCMHSFCKRCLQGISASAMTLKCPECRKDIKLGKKGVDGLSKNFQLASIVASYQDDTNHTVESTQQSNTRLPSCTVHRIPCELHCKTCKRPVCLKCLTDGQHPAHIYIIQDESGYEDKDNDVFCDQHSLQYRLYCSTCQTLVCLKCIVSKDHVKHALSAIDKAYEHRKTLFEDRLKEFEKQQKVVRSNWKFCRDLTQKTQLDANNKKEELSAYFKRLKAILERRETDLKLELETRENKAMEDCKRQTDLLQASEKRLNSAIGQTRQLLTEERLQMLNINSSQYERGLISVIENDETEIKPFTMPSPFENMSLVTCQFEKEVREIRWEWPKQVYEPSQIIMPTAPPSESTSMKPIPRPRRRFSQKEEQYCQSRSNQQYYTQQHYQQNGQQQQQQPRQTSLQKGSLVQRGKHWKSAMEDGGPGHFGTVTQTMLDPHVYMVIWPNGKSGSYTYNPPWKEEVIPP